MGRVESEIFNEYIKQAERDGLISEADYAEARIGSDTEEVIQMLYGVRPNPDVDTKIGELSALIERAHPETVVIAPAHDRMNSVLENVKERQAIMVDIALRTPSGDLTMRRYVRAHDDLMHSLVRAGFAMENAGETELMKMADACSITLNKKAQWLTPVLAIVGILTAIGIINNTDDIGQNVKSNAERVIRELDNLSDKNPEMVATMQSNLRELQESADIFMQAASDIANKTNHISNANDVVELAQKIHGANGPDNQSADDGGLSNDLAIVNKYEDLLKRWEIAIPQYDEQVDLMAENEDYHYDWYAKLKWLANKLDPDDYADVKNALGGLKSALDKALKIAEQARAAAQSGTNQIQQSLNVANPLTQKPSTKPAAAQPPDWQQNLSHLAQ